jgi:hypothetical protein
VTKFCARTAAQVSIGLNEMKDWAPHRHLARAVCGEGLNTFEDVAHAVAGKLASGAFGEAGEVGSLLELRAAAAGPCPFPSSPWQGAQ